MVDLHPAFPALRTEHLNDARLFATREDMFAGLYGEQGGVVAEVGVGLGDFSRFLVSRLRPSRFIAIDRFNLHTFPTIWGEDTKTLFGGGTHRVYYQRKMQDLGCELTVLEGDSHRCLGRVGDESLDLLYIDAGHQYEEVLADAQVASLKLKRNGLLVFNDYVMVDHLYNTPFGVVQAVNELVVSSNWRVVGFALQHQMFCDIALRRS